MNRIVCNASPIIALSSINSLGLLAQLFDEIYIPQAVYREVIENSPENAIGRRELLFNLEKGYFKIYEVKNKESVDQLYGKLHYGELEVIIAAKELDISSVILDDIAARKLAETFLLQPVGTLGVLLLAKQEGIVPAVKSLVDELVQNHHFRISKTLYERILKEVNE
ncbi:DUF3368 domain-containing protein [Effusibacillus consociatus]|uniref:DUF3368 domain-containing protein n=1 Tax=Effusibacillus consociatus TaxID=1117041 RepID=A0ABV9PZM3_9BACL